MTLRWIPNAITLSRMASAVPLLWLLASARYHEAFWLAVAAGASDALDGGLAKRFGWRSVLGGVLDPIADKLLLSACFLGLWWGAHAPGWLTALVLGRDAVILIGALVWWRLARRFDPAPSALGKATTALQIVLAASVLADLSVQPLPAPLLQALAIATALVTVASGADYVMRYGAKAADALRSRP